MAKCGMTCEVFSRVVGYMRPVSNWNRGKKSEWKERKEFDLEKSFDSKFADKQPISTTKIGQTELR